MKAVIMKFFPGDQESSFAFFSFSCVWSTSPLLATAWSCARQAAVQPRPPCRYKVASAPGRGCSTQRSLAAWVTRHGGRCRCR